MFLVPLVVAACSLACYRFLTNFNLTVVTLSGQHAELVAVSISEKCALKHKSANCASTVFKLCDIITILLQGAMFAVWF